MTDLTDEPIIIDDLTQTPDDDSSLSQQQQQSSAPVAPEVDDAYSSEQALAAFTIRLGKNSSKRDTANADSSSTPNSSSPSYTDSSIPSLHLLPCRIAHTGPAAVPNFFRPSKRIVSEKDKKVLTYGADGIALVEQDDNLFDARFRGRQLTGQIIDLSSATTNTKGYIFEEDHTKSIEVDADADNNDRDKEPDQTMKWRTVHTFDSLMLWQPDLELNERKHIKEAILDWIPIAHAVS